MLSMKAQYGLRAMMILAQHSGQYLQCREIAAEGEMPRKFLETILNDLKRAGLIVSRRGALGGYTLGRSPAHIAAGDIVRSIDGALAPLTHAGEGTSGYAIDKMIGRVRRAIADVLDHTSLLDMRETDSHVRIEPEDQAE